MESVCRNSGLSFSGYLLWKWNGDDWKNRMSIPYLICVHIRRVQSRRGAPERNMKPGARLPTRAGTREGLRTEGAFEFLQDRADGEWYVTCLRNTRCHLAVWNREPCNYLGYQVQRQLSCFFFFFSHARLKNLGKKTFRLIIARAVEEETGTAEANWGRGTCVNGLRVESNPRQPLEELSLSIRGTR